MIIVHFILGFLVSYLGLTPPGMLNLTASKIYLEKSKKDAYQFTLGVSIIVFIQFLFSFLIISSINNSPNIIFWIKNIAVVLLGFVSVFFLKKGTSENINKKSTNYKNNFIYGLSLSFINMFAIPFFVITYSLLKTKGFVNTELVNVIIFAFGVFFGTVSVLSSYFLLLNKFKNKTLNLTKFFNPIIGIIAGFSAIYTAVKLYL